MNDPLQPVNPGDPLVIQATTWNTLLSAARERTERTGPGKGVPQPALPACLVYVKPGSSVVLWGIQTPTGEEIDPTDVDVLAARHPVFASTAPTSADDPIVITQRPCQGGRIARAVAAGVTVAEVVVTDTAHRFARPIPDNAFQLTSAASGPAYLLVKATETGTAKRLVLLGMPQATPAEDAACGSTCNWVARLKTTDCVRLRSISGVTVQEIYLTRSGDVYTSGATDFDYPSGSGPVEFSLDASGRPVLTIDDLPLVPGCNGDTDATFSGGAWTGHAEETGDDCAGTLFCVRVECSCCPISGWHGPGIYCVEYDPGPPRICVPAELLDADKCDGDIVICSGPYATLEDAEAACCRWGGPGWYCTRNEDGTCSAEFLDEDAECNPDIIPIICSGPYVDEETASAACGTLGLCCEDTSTASFTLAGVTTDPGGEPFGCDCSVLNTAWSLAFDGEVAGVRTWSETVGIASNCNGNTNRIAILTCDSNEEGSDAVTLTIYFGVDEVVQYTGSKATWVCPGPNVLTRGFVALNACATFPTTLTVTMS